MTAKTPKRTPIPAAVLSLTQKATGAYISYIDADGFPVCRAMLAPRKRAGIKTFYFTTNTSSQKVRCLRENPKVSVYFVDRRFYRAVCFSGRADILQTPKAKKMIWRKGDEMYYPLGVTDPDYCVLKITVEKGRYYASFSSRDFTLPRAK